MRNKIIRCLVALLTFVVGLTTVWSVGFLYEIGLTQLNPFQSDETIISFVEPTKPKDSHRFTPTFRACGAGYVQGYETNDGQELTEGSAFYETSANAKRAVAKTITTATRIVERNSNFKNRFDMIGERIALIYKDETGKERASILWYDGGQIYTYINAPSLALALEFEQSNAYAY